MRSDALRIEPQQWPPDRQKRDVAPAPQERREMIGVGNLAVPRCAIVNRAAHPG